MLNFIKELGIVLGRAITLLLAIFILLSWRNLCFTWTFIIEKNPEKFRQFLHDWKGKELNYFHFSWIYKLNLWLNGDKSLHIVHILNKLTKEELASPIMTSDNNDISPTHYSMTIENGFDPPLLQAIMSRSTLETIQRKVYYFDHSHTDILTPLNTPIVTIT